MTHYAPEIEEAILGTCLTDAHAFQDIKDIITPDCFYIERNRDVYSACLEFDKPDLMLVEQYMKDRGEDTLFLMDFLSKGTPRHEEYCQILIEKKIKRDTVQAAQDVLKYANDADAYALVDKFNALAGKIGINTSQKHSLTPSEIKERDKNTPKAEKLWFGYSDLDHGIFGDSFRRGQVVLTMADSGHGKTVFTRMLARMLTSQGRTVHWFQLEGYDSETAQEVDNDLITICDSLDDIEDIKREARRIDRERKKSGIENGTDYLVFDYVQNIECNQKISKTEKVEYISRQLTKLAIELGAVSNIVSQVTIEGTRTGWQQEPRYNDVRWSKQLKQDASTMIAVFRPSRIESLVENDAEVQDWKGDPVPYDSVFIKQVKVRHGKQEHKRLHLIHTDEGLKPYTNREQVPF